MFLYSYYSTSMLTRFPLAVEGFCERVLQPGETAVEPLKRELDADPSLYRRVECMARHRYLKTGLLMEVLLS